MSKDIPHRRPEVD